jgi:heat shock protein HslJ
MNPKRRILAAFLMLIVPLFVFVHGCSQADNPTPTAAPPPPAPKQSELELPKVKGKAFDPASNERYRKMQENMAKQSGS